MLDKRQAHPRDFFGLSLDSRNAIYKTQHSIALTYIYSILYDNWEGFEYFRGIETTLRFAMKNVAFNFSELT